MIDRQSVLALVPARGGSKGLPRKNILDLAGRPLIAWTIAAALESQYIDRCVVSTDDAAIADAALHHGAEVPFMRPAKLADDLASTYDVIEHSLLSLPAFDLLVLLQPTSPLRTAADIDAALQALQRRQAPACVSVVAAAKSPYWSYRIGDDQQIEPLFDISYQRLGRQALPSCVMPNGAIYIARTHWWRENRGFVGDGTIAHIMPAERSIDIDTAFDLQIAACCLAGGRT